ncbi:MAG TPA: autotransporter-associated beta strand repeat-containing protein, partial [Thermoanaerobaculia bacterium]|nr:autotransporter-associated beta strand repeat-containing protein [Thermoanaerobaculia bacterium]
MLNRTLLVALASIGVLSHTAAAATKTWNGSAGSSWSANGNWTPSGAPASGDDLVFPANTMATPVASFNPTNDLAAGTLFHTILVQASGYTISGNGIQLNSGLTAQNVSGASTLSLDVSFFPTQSIAVSNAGASLTFSGSLTIGFSILGVSGSGDVTMTGSVGGTGAMTKNGAGRLTLSGTNTFGGTMSIVAGTVRIQHASALGSAVSATTVSAGAALEID